MKVPRRPKRYYEKSTTSSTSSGQTLITIPYLDSNADRVAVVIATVRGYRSGGTIWSTRLVGVISSTAFVGTTSVQWSIGTSLGTVTLDDNSLAGPFTVKVTPGSATSTKWWVDVEVIG